MCARINLQTQVEKRMCTTECSVCSESHQGCNTTSPCGDVFHKRRIKKREARKNACPLRRNVLE